VLKLLFRFYDIKNGDILIDGISMKDYKISEIRKNIAMIPQGFFL